MFKYVPQLVRLWWSTVSSWNRLHSWVDYKFWLNEETSILYLEPAEAIRDICSWASPNGGFIKLASQEERISIFYIEFELFQFLNYQMRPILRNQTLHCYVNIFLRFKVQMLELFLQEVPNLKGVRPQSTSTSLIHLYASFCQSRSGLRKQKMFNGATPNFCRRFILSSYCIDISVTKLRKLHSAGLNS